MKALNLRMMARVRRRLTCRATMTLINPQGSAAVRL
jgi:hypothetical protein